MNNPSALKLGAWDLSGLVKDPSSSEFAESLESIKQKVETFEAKRQMLRPDIPSLEYETMIHDIENIYENLSIAAGYTHLRYYADTSSNEASALVTKMDKMGAEIGNRLLFFDLWFKKELDEQNAKRLIESMPEVYREYLLHKRLLAKHSLSEPEEKIINTLEVTGTGALVKIYDKMTSGFDFEMMTRSKAGKKKTRVKGITAVARRKQVKEAAKMLKIKKFDNKEKLVSFIRSPDPAEREAAYKALFAVYKKNSGVLGEIYQNIVLEWRNEGISMRGYNTPISIRNIANNLDDETVDALLATCRKNINVFHEYFKEKAQILGMKKLRRFDLYAPLSTKKSGMKKFTFGKAVTTVLDTFGGFDAQLRAHAERVFEERHVDSEIRKAKRGGAFCHTISPSITPYILVNFDGKTRDVSTLAHEFGHAIHSMLASKLPITVSHAPLPLAETASVFSEMLLNERLIEKIPRQEQRLLLAEQIDDMYATIMRQAYFTLFEIDAHREIGEKNATIDQITEVYTRNLKEQFGNSVAISPEFGWEWTYIPHFYHTPFYCYAYSFGNLLVLSLYRQYKLEGKSSFVPKYLSILAAGGSKKPERLLKESGGMDITREEFWQQGFDLVNEKVQQLKSLAAK